jgi:ribonuclease HI
MGKLNVYFDGACDNVRNNTMGIGVVGYLDDVEVFTKSKALVLGTNNQAEYLALAQALILIDKYVAANEVTHINIYSDSLLVVKQIAGEWKIKEKILKELCAAAILFLDAIPIKATLHWIPRKQNKRADELSKKCLDFIRKPSTTNV